MDMLKMRNTVHRLVEMLIAGDYDGLERASRGRRLTGEQFARSGPEGGRFPGSLSWLSLYLKSRTQSGRRPIDPATSAV